MRMLVLFAVLASVLLPAPAVPPACRPSVRVETWAGEPLDEVVKGMVPESAYKHFNGGEPPRE